jgi:hypothetical protein
MNKKNRTEITPKLKVRISKARAKARSYIAKTEIIQFRLDAESYHNLSSIAEREHKAIGTLVREWVTEKAKLQITNKAIPSTLESNNSSIVTIDHIMALQQQIDELKKEIS